MASIATAANERASIEAFRRDVIEASMTNLVILDFWAEWCGPCKALGPILEKVAADYADRGVRLAKVDVDKNQTIAQQFRIQSIPTVYAVHQGRPVADLTPARTESQLKAYLDQILEQLKLAADPVAAAAADLEPIIESARAALAEGNFDEAEQMFAALSAELPDRADLAGGRAKALLSLGRTDEADAVLAELAADEKDPVVAQARAALVLARTVPVVDDLGDLRARVAADPLDMEARFELAGALMAAQDHDGAADHLLEMIRIDRSWHDGAARDLLLKLFEAVGLEDSWVMSVRRRLSAILFA